MNETVPGKISNKENFNNQRKELSKHIMKFAPSNKKIKSFKVVS